MRPPENDLGQAAFRYNVKCTLLHRIRCSESNTRKVLLFVKLGKLLLLAAELIYKIYDT